MAEKEKSRVTGPRAAVLLTSVVASFIERFPDSTKPTIEFNGYGDDRIRFYVWGSGSDRKYDGDYGERKRKTIEAEYNLIMDHFVEEYGELDWQANDPSSGETSDKSYFILTAIISGVKVELFSSRDSVGEAVGETERVAEVIETKDGYVKVERTTVTMWKPNLVLNNYASNGHALAVGRLSKELES